MRDEGWGMIARALRQPGMKVQADESIDEEKRNLQSPTPDSQLPTPNFQDKFIL